MASQKLKLATRSLVADTLTQVFGATAKAPVEALITTQYAAFSGEPCDRYVDKNCAVSESTLSMLPGPSSLRFALVNRACNQIVQSDAALSNAAKLAAPEATTNEAPNDAQIESLFEIFHGGRAPTKEVLGSLSTLVRESMSLENRPLEAWRFLLLSLCENPGWQLL